MGLSALLAVGAWGYFGLAERSSAVAFDRPLTSDRAAEVMYLQGRYDLSTRTASGVEHAAAEFQAAIKRDPRFAAAYAGLGEAYLMLREYGDMADRDAYPNAEAAARKAVKLDPSLAAAHRVIGFVSFWWHGDVLTARRAFATAIKLAPNEAETHHWLATALSANGERPAALSEIMQARRLDPQSTAILADYGYVLYLNGQPSQGLDILRDVQAAAPRSASPHVYVAQFALETKDGALYLKEAALGAALRGDAAGQSQVEAARRGFTRDGINGLLRALFDGTSSKCSYRRAALASLMGRPTLSLSLLAEAKAGHDPELIDLAGDPSFVAMRGDPRFASYFRRPSLQS